MSLKESLKENIFLMDGAMGSYFSMLHSDPHYPCEYANLTSPHTISEIHKRYLSAGAMGIKTNTFTLSREKTPFSAEEIIEAAFRLAKQQADAFDATVFADISIPEKTQEENLLPWYQSIVDCFLEQGAENFLFETCTSGLYLNELADYIKEKSPESFVLCSFAVQSDGFTHSGHKAQSLLDGLSSSVDGAGLNCICGPHHMLELVENIKCKIPFSAMPNASYPTVLGNRVSYGQNPRYFAEKMLDIAKEGCQILGGCCGTTPDFIAQMRQVLDTETFEPKNVSIPVEMGVQQVLTNPFYEKLKGGEMPIAVEWDSPVVPDISDYMARARQLQGAGVDLLTIADGPGARPRMDSSLVACKVKRELNMDTLPHMTCRDRNMNACKALLLGLSVEEINNVLLITGDPIPQAQRQEVKAVYEFNSRKLMHHITQLNQSLFHNPFYLYGALNINAVNFDVQLRMAREKIENGAVAFFTQPVMSLRGFENLKRAHAELSAPLVTGIFPATSHRNISFLTNEMSGFHVADEIFDLYLDKSPEECTELAIRVSSRIVEEIRPYTQGYYLITPFKRVDLILEILKNMDKK